MGASLARREEVRLLSAQSNFQPFEDRPERWERSEEVCAVCLSELSRAKCFQLPECGHNYHALCVASAFQIQQLCPLCRTAVSDGTCMEVARSLFAGAGVAGARFAAELLTELAQRQRTVDEALSLEETINAMRRAAKQGDDSKIPMIAAVLQSPANSSGDVEIELRIAAVQALRALVPAFPAAWPGWQAVRGLLQSVSLADTEEELRLAAIQALKEVSRRDARDEALFVARGILEDRKGSRELRLAAGALLQAIAGPSDFEVARVALLALDERYSCSLRTHAAHTLRSCAGPRGASPGLVLELARVAARSEWPEARCEAVNLVGQIEDFGGEGMIALAAALEDKHDEVSQAAVRAIASLWPPEPGQASQQALQALLLVLAQPERAELRCEVLLVLPRLVGRGISEAAAAVGVALADSDVSVSNAAAQALRKMSLPGDRALQDILLQHISRPDPELCKVCVELLGLIFERGSDGERTLIALRDGPDEDLASVANSALKRL